ncbi:hypothetical protein [Persicobacter psychrovividus]|uniref:Uncharacterized protein n=1 Tax=Persicobacter psychrovividus TaxID=387638 RepID=A0ABM7VKG1_9BACT|nr:hypothetical protein PEPS_37590 [Persicobacter psychrovividus]
MKKILASGIILFSTLNLTFAQQATEHEQLCKEVSELIVMNKRSEFVKRFSPTKEDLLEFSYGTKADKVEKKERAEFFNSVTPTIGMLKENISSSFDFVHGKLEGKGILKLGDVEIIKSTQSKIGETEVQNIYFIISNGQNQFKVELLGVYRTSRDWIIMTDVAPWYF